MNPGPAALRAILERCGITLTAEQRDQLWTYHQLLRQANPELNLTRIHNFENMVLKHYVDSLLVLKHESLGSPLVDMGSGPGLPGIPLKIARPDLHIILAEPRHHRAAFLERVCATLKLDQIEVFAGKVGPRFRRQVTGVISRAVGSIPETLERVSEVIAPGGRMYFMKGPACDDEIAAARSALHDRFRMVADHRYMIPGTSHQRRLVVYERTSSGTAGPPPPILTRVREVTSSSNPTFQVARDLLTGRGVRKHGQALLAGTKSVAEMLARFPDRVEGWLTGQQGPPPPDPSLRWFRLAEGLFRELDVSGTHAPLLLVRVPEMPEWSSDTALPEGCTIFVPFQDPENVGAVIRSAAAFQAAQVVLLREAAHPFHVRASRAAGTALFQVPLRRGPSLRDLDPQAVPLIALSNGGEDLARCSWPDRFGLVPGLEGPGLPDRLRQGACRRIPIATSVDSLNGATAVAIALYEWRRASRIPATSVPLGPGEAAPGE